jgi:hypothetical protein
MKGADPAGGPSSGIFKPQARLGDDGLGIRPIVRQQLGERRMRSTCAASGGGTRAHAAPSVHIPSGTSTCRCGVTCSTDPKYCRNPTPPPCSFPRAPSRFAHRRCQAQMARTSRRSIRARKAGCFTSAHLARNGADRVHCRHVSCGSSSPHSAAVSCELLVPHDGHSPRCLQLKATSSVRRHVPHFTCTKPRRTSPHPRYRSTSVRMRRGSPPAAPDAVSRGVRAEREAAGAGGEGGRRRGWPPRLCPGAAPGACVRRRGRGGLGWTGLPCSGGPSRRMSGSVPAEEDGGWWRSSAIDGRQRRCFGTWGACRRGRHQRGRSRRPSSRWRCDRPCGRRGESAWDHREGSGVACARNSPADGCIQAFAERRRSVAAVARKRCLPAESAQMEGCSSSQPTDEFCSRESLPGTLSAGRRQP